MSNATPWQTMLSKPDAGHRIAQFYRNEDQLTETVSYYIAEGLRLGDAAIIVATPAHWAAFVGRLVMHKGFDLVDMVMRGQLRIMDANVTLSAVMAGGMPQWHRFQETGGDILERARKRHKAVRVYGDMTDMLWQKGKLEAAGRIEECWSALAQQVQFSLLSSYRIDDFDTRTYHQALDCAYKMHTHLLPRFDGHTHASKERGATTIETMPVQDSKSAAA